MAAHLILGATGRVGSALVPLLLSRGDRVLALTRRPAESARLSGMGAEPVVGDYREPETVRRHLEGIDGLFLATADARDQDRVEAGIVEAAARAGTPHIVKLSAQSAGLDPPRSFGRFHRESERMLEAGGLPFTILRPTFFLQSLLLFAGEVAGKRKLIAPAGRGRAAMVDIGDIARCAAAVLGQAAHHGRTYTLTGPSAVGFPEVAEGLSDRLGALIRYVSPPSFAARIVLPFATGMPRWQSNLVVELFDAIRAGAQETVTGEVDRLTGRAPTSLDGFLDENLAAFRG